MERKSERELVHTRTFNGPARMVFEGVEPSPRCSSGGGYRSRQACPCFSCEADVRVGEQVTDSRSAKRPQSRLCRSFGKYIEVIPNSRLVWTNEEKWRGCRSTTLTFEEKGGKTLVVMHELCPSKEARSKPLSGRDAGGMQETFAQLDELLVTLGAEAWDSPEVVDLAVGRLGLPYAEERPDEVEADREDETVLLVQNKR